MEIHQLYYFVAVAETSGFSRAAQRCNVAQPSLSQQIIKLEQELGQQLFERLGRTVTLTEGGRALLPRARSILTELQEIKKNLSQNIDEGYGHLAVGFIPTIAPFLLPSVLKQFAVSYPQAELAVYEDVTDVLVKNLIEGKLDIAIMSLPINSKLIVTEEICTEPLLVALSPQHDLINRVLIKTKDLEEFPFIALNEVHCLGEQVLSFCYQQDVNVEIVCYTSQLSTMCSCIALGLGVSLVPQILAATDSSNQLVYRPVSGVTPRRKIVIASRAGRLQSFLARQFIDLVRSEYNRLVNNFIDNEP